MRNRRVATRSGIGAAINLNAIHKSGLTHDKAANFQYLRHTQKAKGGKHV
jgi:hypothetical protein